MNNNNFELQQNRFALFSKLKYVCQAEDKTSHIKVWEFFLLNAVSEYIFIKKAILFLQH